MLRYSLCYSWLQMHSASTTYGTVFVVYTVYTEFIHTYVIHVLFICIRYIHTHEVMYIHIYVYMHIYILCISMSMRHACVLYMRTRRAHKYTCTCA